MKKRKIAVIGAGLVGVNFVFASAILGTASEYGIIDIKEDYAWGQVFDLHDASWAFNHDIKIKKYTYQDLKDVDLILITAGRPKKGSESRLDMAFDNAKIIRQIALNIKASGFQGITILNSNPVDVMAAVYQKITGYPHQKVISSGTLLDTARLRYVLGKKFNVGPKEVEAFVIGEHGDSSVSLFSSARINHIPLKNYLMQGKITSQELKEVHEVVYKKAYEIVTRKGSTYYGITMVSARLADDILNDNHVLYALGAYLQGEYGQNDVYSGVPVIVNRHGIQEIIEIPLSEEERINFNKSCQVLKENTQKALASLK